MKKYFLLILVVTLLLSCDGHKDGDHKDGMKKHDDVMIEDNNMDKEKKDMDDMEDSDEDNMDNMEDGEADSNPDDETNEDEMDDNRDNDETDNGATEEEAEEAATEEAIEDTANSTAELGSGGGEVITVLDVPYVNPNGEVDMKVEMAVGSDNIINSISATATTYDVSKFNDSISVDLVGKTVEEASEYYLSGSSLASEAFQNSVKNYLNN